MLALLLAALAFAGPAPDLSGLTFIARGPVSEEADPLVLVEVWATWCGPCHATFPALTALQAEHGDRLRVIALSDERSDVARRFFHDNREQMRFAIAVDPTGEVVRSLMFGGHGGRGIPSVYLIRGDEVVWGGAPDGAAAAVAAALASAVGPASP